MDNFNTRKPPTVASTLISIYIFYKSTKIFDPKAWKAQVDLSRSYREPARIERLNGVLYRSTSVFGAAILVAKRSVDQTCRCNQTVCVSFIPFVYSTTPARRTQGTADHDYYPSLDNRLIENVHVTNAQEHIFAKLFS